MVLHSSNSCQEEVDVDTQVKGGRKTKVCTLCGKRKSMEKYPPDKRAGDGKQARCRACVASEVMRIYRERPEFHLLERARQRARRKGMEFDLVVDDITPLPKRCPIFGQLLRPGNGQQNPNAYSLDRIDNNKGYIRGNVMVISYLANRLKNDGTADQHRRIADWMDQQPGENR